MGGGYCNHGLKKYFLADICLFLYTYQLCYISGPPIQKEMVLASKLWLWGPFKNRTQKLENCWLSLEGRQTKTGAARSLKSFLK